LPDDPVAKAVTVNTDPAQEQEWLRQNNLIYGGLIGIGVVLVQPFLTAASLDLSATICVVAFSVAIPLLAALVLVNRQEVFRRRVTKAVTVEVARVVAQLCAATGVVAGVWHIRWIAGVGVLVAGLVGIGGPLRRLRPPGAQGTRRPRARRFWLDCLLGGVRVLVGPPVFKLCFPSSAPFVGVCDLGAIGVAARRRPPRSARVAVGAAVGHGLRSSERPP
jgi:hypothetical protein